MGDFWKRISLIRTNATQHNETNQIVKFPGCRKIVVEFVWFIAFRRVFGRVRWEMLFKSFPTTSPGSWAKSSSCCPKKENKNFSFPYTSNMASTGITYQLTVIGPSRKRIDIDFLISYYWTGGRSWREADIYGNNQSTGRFSSRWITTESRK